MFMGCYIALSAAAGPSAAAACAAPQPQHRLHAPAMSAHTQFATHQTVQHPLLQHTARPQQQTEAMGKQAAPLELVPHALAAARAAAHARRLERIQRAQRRRGGIGRAAGAQRRGGIVAVQPRVLVLDVHAAGAPARVLLPACQAFVTSWLTVSSTPPIKTWIGKLINDWSIALRGIALQIGCSADVLQSIKASPTLPP